MKKKEDIIQEAQEEEQFVVADGRKLSNIVDLAYALDDMPNDIFNHHVNEEKNDFSNWVRDIFNENKLAEDIAKKKSQMEIQLSVMKHVLNKFME